jgi:chromosome partitioning protein
MYDADSKGAVNYLNLAREIMQNNGMTNIPMDDKFIEEPIDEKLN